MHQLQQIEQEGKAVNGTALDPIMAVLVQFNSLSGLKKQILDLFQAC